MTSQIAENLKTEIKNIDDELSKRPIDLDPNGYFIIYLDREAKLIYAKHYTNIINDKGLAVDPDTGEVIACGSKSKPRVAETIFSARTAKELCVKVIEETVVSQKVLKDRITLWLSNFLHSNPKERIYEFLFR